MVYTAVAYIVMAYIVMAYIVMGYTVMDYIIMAYIVLASSQRLPTRSLLFHRHSVASPCTSRTAYY